MTLFHLFLLTRFLSHVLGVSCGTEVIHLTATDFAQTLMSPGYPSDYENNQTCTWLMTARDTGKKIQVEIVSLELANWFRTKCEDFLEFRDGNQKDSPLIKKTCTEGGQFKTKSSQLLVTFITDQHFTAPGFALQFYQIHDYKSSCDPYVAKTFSVGHNPLFLDLPMFSETLDKVTFCDFHFKSELDDDVSIKLEILTYSSISCGDGSFSFYDGSSVQALLILEWCHSNQPFQQLITSGQSLFIRFKLLKTVGLWYVFRAKVSVKIKSVACSDRSIPNLELQQLPTYTVFPMDYRIKSKRACPVRLWAENMSASVRLQVVFKKPSCHNRDVNIYNGYDLSTPRIGSLCEKDVYVSSSHNVVLHPTNENATDLFYIKISSIVSTCSGKIEKLTAIHDIIKYLPEVANSKIGYPHDLNCTYLIHTESMNDAVEVKLSGRMVTKGAHKCNGDTVTLYDGDSLSAPIISTWCGAQQQNKKFTSSGPKMLIIIKTDSYDSFDGVKVAYYSVPQTGTCKVINYLLANASVQYLTSPNEPMYYPINAYCEYKIQATEGHNVLLNVIKSKMEEDCSDNVQVYDGLEKDSANYLGRWCGEDKPSFQSTGTNLLIVFSADEEFNTGGFNASYYAYKKKQDGHWMGLIIGLVVSAVLIIFIIIIIYIFSIRKKRWLCKM